MRKRLEEEGMFWKINQYSVNPEMMFGGAEAKTNRTPNDPPNKV